MDILHKMPEALSGIFVAMAVKKSTSPDFSFPLTRFWVDEITFRKRGGYFVLQKNLIGISLVATQSDNIWMVGHRGSGDFSGSIDKLDICDFACLIEMDLVI